MDGCLCTCRPHPSAPATVPICHGGKNYEDLLKEDKSEPIPFIGNNVDDFTPNALVIVSFPGAYGRAWNFLTKEAAKAESGLNTSCIFLPNSSAPGYGQHIRTGRDGQMCHCMHLYHGQKQYFGCAWFSLWQRKTLEAVKCGCNLLVVTKRDGTLGNSQQGEVRYLQQNAWPYSEMNILDFLMYFDATAPKDQKVLVSRKLQGSVNRCRRAKAETSNRVQSLKLEHQATKQGAQHRVCVDPWTLFWW